MIVFQEQSSSKLLVVLNPHGNLKAVWNTEQKIHASKDCLALLRKSP
jgi:hypothetical protein